MKLASTAKGAVILIIALTLLIYMEVMPYLFSGGSPPVNVNDDLAIAQRFPYLGMQFAALPDWAKVWMSFQDIIMGSALFFVLWHRAAQIYVASYIVSHIFIFSMVAFAPIDLLTLNLAAFSHWFWIPALFLLLKNWPNTDKRSGYGTWCTIAIAQLCFSLFFDIPDGFKFMSSII